MSISKTPIALVQRRGMNFDFSDIESNWCDGNEFKTAFFTAFSLIGPVGERFFIRVMRGLVDDIKDEKMKKDVKGFILQEAMHASVHQSFNKALEKHGVDVTKASQGVEAVLDKFVADLSPKDQLLFLAAGEHVIYELSSAILNDPRMVEGWNTDAVRLFKWHALEEIEHKSVCFDLCEHLYGISFKDKARTFLAGIGTLVRAYKACRREVMKAQRPTKDRTKKKLAYVGFLYLSPGLLTRVFRRTLYYMFPGFHPWTNKDHDLKLVDRTLGEIGAG